MIRGIIIGATILAIGIFAAEASAQQRKGKKGTSAVAKAAKKAEKDKSNDVVGAMWHITAINSATGQKEAFVVRVKNGVLYSRLGDEVGSVRAVKADTGEGAESEMKWGAKLPLQGSFRITMNKVGHWSGVLITADEAKWVVRADVKDR